MKLAEHDKYELMLLDTREVDFNIDLEIAMDHLAKAIPFITGASTRPDIIKKAQNNQCLVFTGSYEGNVVAACLVTMYKRRDVLAANIELTGGDEDHYQKLMPAFLDKIEQYVKKTHAVKYSRVIGRPGWWRRMKAMGYTPTHFFAEKEL